MSKALVQDEAGSVTVTDAALAELIGQAVASVDGVRLRKGRRRLGLEIENGHARADLELVVRYGAVLPEAARAVQERVADALARMCGLAVDGVDVTVEELDA